VAELFAHLPPAQAAQLSAARLQAAGYSAVSVRAGAPAGRCELECADASPRGHEGSSRQAAVDVEVGCPQQQQQQQQPHALHRGATRLRNHAGAQR
jgi:hypothetical protein